MARQPPSGRGSPHYRSFTVILRHTTLGRTPLDEWSVPHRDLYLKTHNTHKRHTSMSPAGFEPAIPTSERQHTRALDRAATGTGKKIRTCVKQDKTKRDLKLLPNMSKSLSIETDTRCWKYYSWKLKPTIQQATIEAQATREQQNIRHLASPKYIA